MPIFNLITDAAERRFATILPIPRTPIIPLINNLKARFLADPNPELSLYQLNPTIDMLTSLKDIRELDKWVFNK
jgi:hypothetical protein